MGPRQAQAKGTVCTPNVVSGLVGSVEPNRCKPVSSGMEVLRQQVRSSPER